MIEGLAALVAPYLLGIFTWLGIGRGLRYAEDRRATKTPAPGEGSPRPAAATPRGPQVPGLPWPPQHDCGAVIEHIEVEIRECGCHIKLDHLRRKRKIHHCGRLDFDVTEWERRLTL